MSVIRKMVFIWRRQTIPCLRHYSLIVLWALCCPSWAIELDTLVSSARERDPAYAIAKAQVEAAGERRLQARAGLLPVAELKMDNHQSRNERNSPNERRFWTKQWTFQLSQPLFKPANYYALSQAEKLQAQAGAQLAAAESDLAGRIVTAWFEVITAQEVLRAIRGQRDATQQQLTAAKRSFEVGSVSVADVREVEAKHAVVLAQEAQADSELLLKKATLGQATGVIVDDLDAKLWMKPALNGQLLSLADWQNQVQEGNPSIIQARYQVQAASADVSKARSAHSPNVELVVNNNIEATTGSSFSENRQHTDDLQVGVQVSVPIFSGLGTNAKIREALALHSKAIGERDLAGDQVLLAVKQAYFGLRGALAQIPALETAQNANTVAVQANKRGYQVGMRTNVDVLNAMAQLYQTEKDLARARADAWLYYLRLRILTGQWTEDDLHAF